MIRIKKGLDVPLTGSPKQTIEAGPQVKRVALTGSDYVGMKPSMKVQIGETVKIGQVLFECKKNEGLAYTSPVNGKVVEINRGAKRVFQTLVVEVTGHEQIELTHYKKRSVSDLSSSDVRSLLLESGQWTALRMRPFSKVALLTDTPKAVFINAMDTNPLAANPDQVIGQYAEDFKAGVEVLSKLTEGKTYVCKAAGSKISTPTNVVVEEFAGPHPAGLVGTHIHFLDAVHADKTVWHAGYQDVIAIGKLFTTGKIWSERVISVAGPKAKNPRLLTTTLGANVLDIVANEQESGELRIVSGSVLNGRKVEDAYIFLGRYHNQISILEEGREREFLGWQMPGLNKFSIKRTFVSKFFTPSKKFNMNTTTHGSARAMVPVGMYERVIPMDVLPTQLLRSLLTKDTDLAQQLGCLEFDEEDLALCTFASVGKKDFGPILRESLTIIEKEG
ncbi:NADH:ubiquinone reductase (Na(+)-transporting) subunit A [Halobacteriovorax marinus]|uniref:Na(+)-translocating NADH-quinone reductase subunit A n=1 Tax=Halobacteriovorax marinus TaxID=97084 RepID=A0A1Y5FGG9_9BACT|nr:NADH:ubiquinone reductase (Na(+)-transporting) subunit A [Halobacteriovorax marinus]